SCEMLASNSAIVEGHFRLVHAADGAKVGDESRERAPLPVCRAYDGLNRCGGTHDQADLPSLLLFRWHECGTLLAAIIRRAEPRRTRDVDDGHLSEHSLRLERDLHAGL